MQEARSSSGGPRVAAPLSTAAAALLEEEGTDNSIQLTTSLPMMGTSFPANVDPLPIFAVVFFRPNHRQNPKKGFRV